MHKWYKLNKNAVKIHYTCFFLPPQYSLNAQQIVAVFDRSHNLSILQHQNEYC